MKKLILTLSLLVTVAISLHSQEVADVEITPGCRISWNLSLGYPFNIIIDQVKPDFVFTWDMGSNASGKNIIKAKAVKKAIKMTDYFNDGATVTMEDATTVIFSKALYKKMKAGSSTEMTLDGIAQTLRFVKSETLMVAVDGADVALNVIYAETDKNGKFWIWDNAKTPIILRMELGWSLTIESITTKK